MSRGRLDGDWADRYDTPPEFVRRFLECPAARRLFDRLRRMRAAAQIWEPAAGSGNFIGELRRYFPYATVLASDIEPRDQGIEGLDYLAALPHGDRGAIWHLIITNPPFRLAEQFVRQAHHDAAPGGLIVMYLRAAFLESAARNDLFQGHMPYQVYFESRRPAFAGPNTDGKSTDAAMYAWFVWRNDWRRRTSFTAYRI